MSDRESPWKELVEQLPQRVLLFFYPDIHDDLDWTRDTESLEQEMRKRLTEAGAPKLAHRIGSVAVRSSGEDRVFPATWREAWNWARMRRHLDKIESREELITLAERRREMILPQKRHEQPM